MTSIEDIVDALVALHAGYDEQIAAATQRLQGLRCDLREARRAQQNAQSGSAAMKAIGEAAAQQAPQLESQIDATHATIVEAKSRRKATEKALHWLSHEEQAAPLAGKVRPLVHRLLDENDGLTYQEAYDLTREALAEQGVSAQGLGLRMQEALAESSVACDDAGYYRLQTTANEPGTEAAPPVMLPNRPLTIEARHA